MVCEVKDGIPSFLEYHHKGRTKQEYFYPYDFHNVDLTQCGETSTLTVKANILGHQCFSENFRITVQCDDPCPHYPCPANASPKPGLQCVATLDDCQCNSGFVANNAECVAAAPACQSTFQCPDHSQPNTQCVQSIADCDCETGYVKDIFENRCAEPCTNSYLCPLNSFRLPNRDCYDSFNGTCVLFATRQAINLTLLYPFTRLSMRSWIFPQRRRTNLRLCLSQLHLSQQRTAPYQRWLCQLLSRLPLPPGLSSGSHRRVMCPVLQQLSVPAELGSTGGYRLCPRLS